MNKFFNMLLKLLVVLVFVVWANLYNSDLGLLIIYYFDIGQGDSVLIITPDRKKMLVDGGPDNSVLFELGKVLPVWDRKLDYIIATHPDADHINGLVDVLERNPVNMVLHNRIEHKTKLYERFLQLSEKHNLQAAYSNNDFALGCCVSIDIVWPKQGEIKGLDSNDTSLSIVISYKNFNMFLGGDLSKNFEEDAMLPTSYQQIELYKAAHHGSRSSTSEKVIAKFRPQVAIISAAMDNKFGHPHAEVLAVFEKYRTQVLKTYELGTITFVSDGRNFWQK